MPSWFIRVLQWNQSEEFGISDLHNPHLRRASRIDLSRPVAIGVGGLGRSSRGITLPAQQPD